MFFFIKFVVSHPRMKEIDAFDSCCYVQGQIIDKVPLKNRHKYFHLNLHNKMHNPQFLLNSMFHYFLLQIKFKEERSPCRGILL